MPHIVWNLEQIDVSEDEARQLEEKKLIYDPMEGDPSAEMPERVMFYPTDDEDPDPLTAIERALDAVRAGVT